MIGFQRFTPGVKNILILTTAFWLVDMLLLRFQGVDLGEVLALCPDEILKGHELWTPITYLLIHQGFWHWFWNMIVLWMFGSPVEEVLGERRLYQLYLVCGVSGALVAVMAGYLTGDLGLVTPQGWMPTEIVGASGAVLGITIAFAMLFPEATVYLWLVIPVKAKYLALFVIALAVFAPMAAGESDVSVSAHVGGLLGGWVVLHFKLWLEPRRRKPASSGAGQPSKIRVVREPVPPPKPVQRPATDPDAERGIDRILDKIGRQGMDSLTPDERNQLDAHSTKLRQRDGLT